VWVRRALAPIRRFLRCGAEDFYARSIAALQTLPGVDPTVALRTQ
jgi:hypothetical protein